VAQQNKINGKTKFNSRQNKVNNSVVAQCEPSVCNLLLPTRNLGSLQRKTVEVKWKHINFKYIEISVKNHSACHLLDMLLHSARIAVSFLNSNFSLEVVYARDFEDF
jgi:hypothetical protein